MDGVADWQAKKLENLQDKLDAAIYIIHQLARTNAIFSKDEVEAKLMYEESMANYRDIIERAGGPSAEANKAEVEMGFHVTEAESKMLERMRAQ